MCAFGFYYDFIVFSRKFLFDLGKVHVIVFVV